MCTDIARKLDEFCTKGNLGSYRDVLQEIFQKISENNCRISARYDSDNSLHSADTENGCRIRISLSKKYERPEQVIWIILHEFGHHLVGPISKKDENKIELLRENERKAWEKAFDEMCLYEKLKAYKDDFENYKNECLNTYE